MEIIYLALDQLELSPRNVRSQRHQSAIDQLAASITKLGLISPLVVTRKGKTKNKFLVEAGGNRLAALRQMQDEGVQFDWQEIPCALIEDEGQITELSLAENHARQQMRPVEIYQAFGKIKAEKPAATYEDLGAMFGYDAARVARIMRLANLAPTIFALYLDDQINDAQAMAFAATDDHAKQMAVYDQCWAEGQPQWKREPREIKAALKVNRQETRRALKFVGLEAYEAAGGRATRDLFGTDEDVIIEDEALLEQLVMDKFDLERAVFEGKLSPAEHARLSWVAEPPQIERYGSRQTDYELRIETKMKRSKADEKLLADLNDQCEALCNEADAHADEHGQPTEEQRAAINEIEAKIAEVEARGSLVLPKEGMMHGVIALDYESEAVVTLYFASRADKGEAVPKGAKEVRAAAAVDPEVRAREEEGLSRDSMEVLTHIFRDMVRMELYQTASAGSELARDFLVFAQAWSVVHRTSGHMTTYANNEPVGVARVDDPDSGSSSKVMDTVRSRPERSAWAAIEKQIAAEPCMTEADPVNGFRIFLTEDAETKNRIAGFLAAHVLLAGTGSFNEKRTPRMVHYLADSLSYEDGFGGWRQDVTLDEQLFNMLGSKRRKELLAEFGQDDRAKVLKAKETAHHLARVVNADDSTNAQLGIDDEDANYNATWLPEFLQPQQVRPLATAPITKSDSEEQDFYGDPETAAEAGLIPKGGINPDNLTMIDGREHVLINGVPVDAAALAELEGGDHG